jgi:hypothetical protein
VLFTRVVLDSSKVANIPVNERVAVLDRPYPVNLASCDIEEFRKMLQRTIAMMHRAPDANKGGNAQKKIRICLNEALAADVLIFESGETHIEGEVPTYAPGFTETEKEYIGTARIGQGQFRRDLIKAYCGRCAVTDIENDQLLIASHIKPWKACTNIERLDPNNGILLSALADKLFDKGLITFADDGRIVVSPTLSSEDRRKCGIDETLSIPLSARCRRYMEYHRAVQFKST